MTVHGSCHCGNITFSLAWDGEPSEIVARACTCSFCRKHGAVWTSSPRGALEVVIRDANTVVRYEFATRTAQFHVCGRCGVVPVVTSHIDGREYAVVNANTFTGDVAVRTTPVTHGDEATSTRLARRQRHWIATVSYRTGPA